MRRTTEKRKRAKEIAAAIAAAPKCIHVTIGEYSHAVTAARAKELIEENQELRVQISILADVGDKLANCCSNSANTGGFRDYITGATPQQVCEILRDIVKRWDYIIANATKREPRKLLPITERR